MARRRRPGRELPAVRPFDVDGVRAVAAGTVLWAIGFVVLAVFRDDLDKEGLGWWLWTCLAGVGLGLLGLEYTRKRRDAIARARLRDEVERSDDVEAPVVVDVEPVQEVSVPEPEPVREEPKPVAGEVEPVVSEPEPVISEPERVISEPEPVISEPEPVVLEPEPETVLAQSPPPTTEWVQAGRPDVEPLISAPTPESRRAHRKASSVDDAELDEDELLLPTAYDYRRSGGRRARRDDSTDDDDANEDGTGYQGRRRRP
jgi:hypothetical protein